MAWYVLQVKTGDETLVRDKLIEYGFSSLVPQENRIVRKGGSWESKIYTLFSGYVFIECNFDAKTYYTVKEIPSVQHWLGTNPAAPSKLSYLEAEWITAWSGVESNSPLQPTKVQFENDNMIIVDGVLKQFENRITKVDKHARKVTIEIPFLNETRSIQLSIEVLE
jgi:transcription antitermination factor NusG